MALLRAVFLSVLFSSLATAAQPLLFSYFKGNGEDGLHLAWSRDGLKFTALKEDKSFLAPRIGDTEVLMRDPCIAQGPDGTFHLVWTVGWREPRMFGYASSRDLINWSQQRAIPAMAHEPGARNCWAPEIFHDKASDRFLIFWSSTIPGRFPATDASGDNGYNHRVYYTTTKDFQQFAPTRLFYDGGFNVIDATMIHALGKYHLIVKDETRNPVARKNLRACTSDSPEGPWSSASEPFTISWVEGPSVVQIGDEYVVYFDHYARPQYYGAIKTRDFKTWEDITGQVSFPRGARHGTVFPVSEAVLEKLLELK
mgnify:CR=1 FL=1